MDWFAAIIGGGVLWLVVVYSYLKDMEGGDDDAGADDPRDLLG